MLNQQSLAAIAAARVNENLGKPLYDSYCFSQIPGAIARCFTGQPLTGHAGSPGLPEDTLAGLPSRYQKVILLFLDGFGWRFFEQFRDELPFLNRILQHGVASQLTTQFPSTTAVHTTTLYTGLPVGESGIPEWYYYEPLVDRVIAPLLFSFHGDEGRETMAQAGVDPKQVFPRSRLYPALAAAGVHSYCFQQESYAHSSFSQTVCEGATTMAYRTVPEAIATLGELLHNPERAYYVLYVDSIDAISHRYGPGSPQTAAEIKALFLALEALLYPAIAPRQDTLLLVSADHGQIDIDPEKMIDLSQQCPHLGAWIRRNAEGTPLIACGGPRNAFVHVQAGAIAPAQAYLQAQLQDRAQVYPTDELIEQGFLGQAGDRLRARLGDLILLPHRSVTIRWQPEETRNPRALLGHHGGLTRDEMEIPLLAIAPGSP